MQATPFDPTVARRRLIAIVRERSFQSGVEIKLASGRTSSFYFNMKPTMLHAEGAHLIARLMLERIAGQGASHVGGLEMGAVPLAAAVAAASHATASPVDAFIVRKAAKDHGTQSLIEGLPRGETLAGRRCIVLEDVTTTGGSALKAAEAVRREGGTVLGVLTVLDRLEGAGEAFQAAGLPFASLLTLADFRD